MRKHLYLSEVSFHGLRDVYFHACYVMIEHTQSFIELDYYQSWSSNLLCWSEYVVSTGIMLHAKKLAMSYICNLALWRLHCLMPFLQIFASDSFLELTEYTREEILGRNCRYKTLLFSPFTSHMISLNLCRSFTYLVLELLLSVKCQFWLFFFQK